MIWRRSLERTISKGQRAMGNCNSNSKAGFVRTENVSHIEGRDRGEVEVGSFVRTREVSRADEEGKLKKGVKKGGFCQTQIRGVRRGRRQGQQRRRQAQ